MHRHLGSGSYLLALIAVASFSVGCSVSFDRYDDRACDEAHPCLAGSGRTCIRGMCQLPWDGGWEPWPDATTTGVIPGTALTSSGPLRVTEAGRVLEKLDIKGCVTIAAKGVVLRNLRIQTDGVCTGPLLELGGEGTLLEDVEIDGTGHRHEEGYSVVGAEATLRRVHVHDVWSGLRIYGSRVTIEQSLIHRLTATTSAGVFVTNGGTDYTLRHNVLELEGPGDAVIPLYNYDSSIKDVLVEANLINGGGYSVYAGGGNASHPASNVRFLRNRFGRKFHPKCGYFGPVTAFEEGNGNVWQDNVWDDTSEPLNP